MSKVSVIVPVYNVENYIRDMLTSVQNQTFKDFEVVIINDGSPDNSQSIIDEFCATDKRFKCFIQENGGVAAARNSGIEKASGDYVVFYDPDDYIPPKALEKMYKTAASRGADMVIGIMEEKSLGESLIYMHSQILARKKHIDPTDENFIGAWSLCNKMFSLNLIKENGLRFERLHNAEDGVFTFCALNCAERICGCRVIAYNYIRRPFWENASATQIVNKDFFNELMKSHDRIIEEALKLSAKIQNRVRRQEYMQKLYFRFIDKEMLSVYYRLIWKADDDLIPLLEERIAMYRKHITNQQWTELVYRHKDLQLERGFLSTEILSQEPDVSIIIISNIKNKKMNMVLGSIYSQLYQRFEVFVPKDYYDEVDPIYVKFGNFRFFEGNELKTSAIKMAKGKYIMFLDEFAIFSKSSLRSMVKKLDTTPTLDFVTILLKHFDGKVCRPIPCINGSYGYTKKSKTSFDKLAKYDILFINKVFRKSVFEKFKFSENQAEDITNLFLAFNFEKLRNGAILTDLSKDEFVYRVQNKHNKILVGIRHKKNECICRVIELLKHNINIEDINRIKKIRRKNK